MKPSCFGKPIAKLGKNIEVISRARIEINAMRLAVLQAAKAMDVLGNKEARVYVSAVKAMVPEKVCDIIDAAIQMHGATGISQWTPLATMYTDTPFEICRRPGRGTSHGRGPGRTAKVRPVVVAYRIRSPRGS